MNNQDICNLIDPILENIENGGVFSANLYAFKTTQCTNHKYLSLSYDFYDTRMKKAQVCEAVANILTFFKGKYLCGQKSSETVFEPYTISNPKKVIDYVELSSLDFNNDSIKDGTIENLNADNYKIQSFLNELKTNSAIAKSKTDYKGVKYTALNLICNDNTKITIVNKGTPIYRQNKLLYLFDNDFTEESDVDYQLINKGILKLPFYPHLIIVGDYCFMIQDYIEGIFGFEQHNKKICSEVLTKISEIDIIPEDSLVLMTEHAKKGKNFNLFANFDDNVINKVIDQDEKTLNLLKDDLKININYKNEIILTEETALRFIHFICGHVKLDMLTNKPEVATKTTPITI